MSISDQQNHSAELMVLTCMLRTELAAADSYAQAMQNFEEPRLLSDLENMREEHLWAQTELREKITRMGGELVDSPGPWSTCAAVTGGVPGAATALAALKQGEEQAINQFEDSLRRDDLDADCKNLIRTHLLSDSRKHVEELNRLMMGGTL